MEKLGDLMAAMGDRLSAVKQQQEKQQEAGGTPDLWTQWGEILNQDLLDMESDLDGMGRMLDPQFALKVVAKASRAWAVVGLILKRVKRYNLWSGMGYKSFADFCQQVLGRSVAYCNNTIRGAEVCLELARAGYNLIPTCQSQAIAMRKQVNAETGRPGLCPEVLRQRWQQILDSARAQCKQITTGFIESILDPDKPIKSDRRVQFDPKTWDLVERGAAAVVMDPKQWLERLIRQQDEANAIETPSPQAEEEWQQDLEELVEEAPQIQQVHHSDGSVAELPTLFDVNRYNAPAPPAQIVEDGPQDFWEPSPVEQNFEQLTIYDALDDVRSPGLAQNTQGDTRQPSPGRMENNEGGTGRQKAKRKRPRRTIGEILGWSGTGAYRPAPGGAT
ncbi:MAG: hypothetical protein F6J93_40700 [Oscillatoria sp. SIO1A7]|nr:hypothetical protein [Oscillatoria sp. SIO1A7]